MFGATSFGQDRWASFATAGVLVVLSDFLELSMKTEWLDLTMQVNQLD